MSRTASVSRKTNETNISVTVDIDSTLCETFGLAKDGAREVMRTGRRGYHPLLAVISGTGDIAHARLRRGRSNDATAAPLFINETISRLRQAGATGQIVLRADSGFYLHDVVAACRAADVRFSIGARMIGHLRGQIEAIPDEQWQPIEYFLPGAGVAEIPYTAFTSKKGQQISGRLVVRRIPELGPTASREHPTLFDTWRFHAFFTTVPAHVLDTVAADKTHRGHAIIEQVHADLKGSALAHLPSGKFTANAAWLVLAVIAFNLTRAAATLASGATPQTSKLAKATSATVRLIEGSVIDQKQRQREALSSAAAS